jgi:uncharacterized protein
LQSANERALFGSEPPVTSTQAQRLPPRPTLLHRGGGLIVLVLAFLAFTGIAMAATPKFPALTGRVVDNAHMLSPGTVERLDSELADLEAKTGHQLVVATVPDLQGLEIEDFGYQLGRAWALGRKGVNDGAILLVAPNQRKVRVEVGYGLEPVLTDALSSVILQEKVLPQFRQGRMEQGVVDGAEALIAQLSLPDDQAKAQVQHAAQQAQPRGGVGPHIPVLIILVIVFWVLSSLLRGRGGIGWLWPLLFLGGGRGGGWGGGGSGGGGGGGGFSGGGGSFGGGGSSGSW